MRASIPMLLATAVSVGNAAALSGAAFEGPVLERRDNWVKGECYSSSGSLTNAGTATYQSSGYCENVADTSGQAPVIALYNGNTCFYGDTLPPESDKVDMSKCNTPCQGYNVEFCGGSNAYLVYTNGQVSADSDSSAPSTTPSPSPSSSPSPSPTTQSKPPVTVVTSAGGDTTIVVTQSANPSVAAATVSVTPTNTGSSNSGGGGTNKAAVAAGVVVGIVGASAIVGAIFFWLRSRRHRDEAAELNRQNSVAGLNRAEKPPSTYSLSDSRLEPAYMRRMSDGSIADNQDYSRRILKVTNPDDR